MHPRVSRRRFLAGTAAGALATALPLSAFAAAPTEAGGLNLGPARAVSLESLTDRARALAAKPYTPPPRPMPEVTSAIDYAAHGAIKYKPELALFADGPGAYPATFFHLGQYFQNTVRMFRLMDGQAREILYSPSYFDMPADSVARKLPQDAGFAGFRLQESRSDETPTEDDRPFWKGHDWLAFLGASYFRAIGELEQYGISARGIVVDAALPDGPEEFPAFTEFYIAPAKEGEPVEILALLDGPSVAGAYRFTATRGDAVVMDVEKHLFFRDSVARLGIAPLTSMYWYGERDKPTHIDWRPEVHDSDGLALHTGGGERLWRPLRNPRHTGVSAFMDTDPRGFGLCQRDRDVTNYLDGVQYERRPTLWVEPLMPFGKGAVQLLEIPTDDEIHDNIGAFWVPETPPQPGDAQTWRYRLHWVDEQPGFPESLARVVATRMGRGGQPGLPRPAGVRKIVVDFSGGPLPDLPHGVIPKANITASRGEVSLVFVEPIANLHGVWRAVFDIAAEGPEPVELRLYLSVEGDAISETWTFPYYPDASA